MLICYLVLVPLCTAITFYVFLEIHYFLRVVLCVLLARLFKRKVHILQETTVKGMCFTTDIDTFISHMNNARFIRELDFARVDFYERTGLFKLIKAKGGSLAMGATTIRYRRFIKLFNRFKITSKIVYWDEKSIYMEHRFISPWDNFVNAIVLQRTRIIGCNAEEVMKELITLNGIDEELAKKCKPELPLDVSKWIESNEISSANLRGDM